jgi:hypothetical protein
MAKGRIITIKETRQQAKIKDAAAKGKIPVVKENVKLTGKK